jgi:hypothetical protein
MKIGQAVGNQTMDESGVYKGTGIQKQANSFIDNSINPATQIQNLKDFSKNITAKTALSQFSGGLFGKSATQMKREAEKDQMSAERQASTNKQLMANAGNFKDGGVLLGKKLNPLRGGSLTAVSDDAVEVNANNPEQDDSVELENAFVDHNEIIDRKNRVFSDSIFLKDGGSIAKHAKRLEKQKAEDRDERFKESNSYLDSKLDSLFNYQEEMKKKKNHNLSNSTINEDAVNEGLKSGGTIHIDPKNKGKFNALKKKTGKSTEELTHSKNPLTKKRAIFAQNAKKWKHQEGGIITNTPPFRKDNIFGRSQFAQAIINQTGLPKARTILPQLGAPTNVDFIRDNIKPKRAKGGFAFNANEFADKDTRTWDDYMQPNSMQAPATKNKFDWQGTANNAATFAPNIASAMLQRKLKGPASPQLEIGVNLQRFSAEPQVAEAIRQTRQAQGNINKNTAQGADLASATGSLLATRLNANNQIYGQNNALNSQIANQEVTFNQGVKGRNLERINQFNNDTRDFSNRKKQMTSENIANASEKIQAKGRERNQIQLDKDKAIIESFKYEDSGVQSRLGDKLKIQDPKAYERLKKQGFFKLGGKLNNKKRKSVVGY